MLIINDGVSFDHDTDRGVFRAGGGRTECERGKHEVRLQSYELRKSIDVVSFQLSFFLTATNHIRSFILLGNQ